MTNGVKISVIVPCYNVENYVGECMESIVNQTFTDIEIICVNDGSTDSTLAILNEYAARDSRVKIIDKPNSGYGASMNMGLKAAKGKYIGIVESDDWIQPEMYEILYREAEKDGLDIVRCLYLEENEIKGTQNMAIPRNRLNEIFSPSEFQRILFEAPSIWAAIYRKDLLEDNGIHFLETPGASYQDTSFAFNAFTCVKKMKTMPYALHNYRINVNSSVNSSSKALFVCTEYEEICRFAKDRGIYEQFKEAIAFRAFTLCKWNYNRLGPMSLKRMFIREWSKYARALFRDKAVTRRYFSGNRIFRTWLVAYCPYVYYFVKKY